jgi:hypothetical protein
MKNSVGTKRAKTSRIEAGSKAVLQAKNPAQKGGQIAVNAEYLQRIKVLSERNEIENHEFRGDSGRCRSVFRGVPITGSGMMAIMIPG